MKIEKFTDVCVNAGSVMHTPSYTNVCKFSRYIFSVDITPVILKLSWVTKVNVFFLLLVYVFNVS